MPQEHTSTPRTIDRPIPLRAHRPEPLVSIRRRAGARRALHPLWSPQALHPRIHRQAKGPQLHIGQTPRPHATGQQPTLRSGFRRLPAWSALLVAVFSRSASAGDPFSTGATAFQTSLVGILTPIAMIAVMASGVLGWFGKISWWWLVGVVIGTVLVFGAPQVVTWIRSMFGV